MESFIYPPTDNKEKLRCLSWVSGNGATKKEIVSLFRVSVFGLATLNASHL